LYKGEQRSCLAAVSRIVVLLVALGREPCANNSGAYCKARAKLSETVLERITARVADGCEKEIPEDCLTTLTDPKEYSRDDVAELYHKRWLVELDIRAIKCSVGMDVLRCKTPAMVRREIWTCLLAYNSIRKIMLQAAIESGLSPRQLSFTNAMQTMAASWAVLPTLGPSEVASMIAAQLSSLTSPLVGNRPNRIEPRAVKRRPKPMRLLNMPREAAREQLLAGVDPYKRRR